MATSGLLPTVLWAQTKECLYLTVQLQPSKNLKLDLQKEFLDVACAEDGKTYALHLPFLHPIKPDESQSKMGRNICFKIVKEEAERWENLSTEGKKSNIKCDWDRWIDSDEEEEHMDDFGYDDMSGLGGMPNMEGLEGMANMGGLGGMPNMGGFGGMPDMSDMKHGDDVDTENSDEEAEQVDPNMEVDDVDMDVDTATEDQKAF